MQTRRQQQKTATAHRIFNVALRLFTEQGFEATTVEAITQAAGVAKGTFFTHFASKEALLHHIGEMQMERLLAQIAADPDFAAQAAPEQIRRVLHTLAAGIEHQPEEMRTLAVELIMRHSLLEIDRPGTDALDDLLTTIIARGQGVGLIVPHHPAKRIAVLVRSCYFLAFVEWAQDLEVSIHTRIDQYIDLLLSGFLQESVTHKDENYGSPNH